MTQGKLITEIGPFRSVSIQVYSWTWKFVANPKGLLCMILPFGTWTMYSVWVYVAVLDLAESGNVKQFKDQYFPDNKYLYRLKDI